MLFIISIVFQGILTPTLLHDIAMSLNGDEWRRLARRLGLTRMRIEAIERDFTEETAFHMLVTWFKRVSRSADKVSLIIHGLTNINRLDLVNELQRLKEERRQELKHSAKDGLIKEILFFFFEEFDWVFFVSCRSIEIISNSF